MLVHTNPHFWAAFAEKRRRKIQTGDFSSAIKGYLLCPKTNSRVGNKLSGLFPTLSPFLSTVKI